MASTQIERKFSWQKEKYFLTEEEKLGGLYKNVTNPPMQLDSNPEPLSS